MPRVGRMSQNMGHRMEQAEGATGHHHSPYHYTRRRKRSYRKDHRPFLGLADVMD